MIDRYGMAIRPPAFLSEDVAKAVFRPPWATLHAVARARSVHPEMIFQEIEPDVLALAKGLQARLMQSGWPESDLERRALVQGTIYDALGPLRNTAGILSDFSIAAKGKSLAWLYGPESMSVLSRMTGRAGVKVNRVALSLYCQDHDGHDVVGAIIRKIDRPDMVTGADGEVDTSAVPPVTPAAPIVALPRPKIPFSPSPTTSWAGAAPPPARAAEPVTLPRTNRWAEVSVAPPASMSGGAGEMAMVLLLAVAVGGALRS